VGRCRIGKDFSHLQSGHTGEVLSGWLKEIREDINRGREIGSPTVRSTSGPVGERSQPSERGRMIWKLGDLIEKHLEEFAQLESLDQRKTSEHLRGLFADVAPWPPISSAIYGRLGDQRLKGNTIPISSGGRETNSIFLAYTLRRNQLGGRRTNHSLEFFRLLDGGPGNWAPSSRRRACTVVLKTRRANSSHCIAAGRT